ncbi:T9SS type A sorting domain-containing protein [Lacinutrix neustonica]|uniref:T9SS type A sorting domain-containing protein n=1 Tax=Lacinutrix neustonica TaxID=2980107 RepID=A0A9E8MZN2_9FLAO|nr:T9SS type A sorting domain-containing protein [Lacinutrix neustonica]WAC03195.1 T9SS type A sorting domain-containing protein [Lacinutrix neustonica]
MVIQDDNTSEGSRVAIDDLSWTCFGTLSAPDFSSSKFNIYPNPIKGSMLNIKTDKSTYYVIFDIIGKRLLSGIVDSNNSEIDVEKLNRGVYILRLKTDNGSFTKKIIKE